MISNPLLTPLIAGIPQSLLMNYMRNWSTRSFPFVKRWVHHLYQSLQIQPILDLLSTKTKIAPHDPLGTLHQDLLHALRQIIGMVIPTHDHSLVAASGLVLKGMLCLNAPFSANNTQTCNQPLVLVTNGNHTLRFQVTNGNPTLPHLGVLKLMLQLPPIPPPIPIGC